MIPLADCRHGYVYEISSRNLVVGVFRAETKGFVGVREKFGDLFLFEEFHKDTGAPYGTVSPTKEIGKCPVADLRTHGDTTCGNCKGKVFYRKAGKADPWQAFWLHVSIASRCNDVRPGSPRNAKLFKYLKRIEAPIRKTQNAEWKKYLKTFKKGK